MLILTRKKDEKIIIDDKIEITIADIGTDHVKIGIQAPKNVKVFRYEVYQAIEKENKEAASTAVILPHFNMKK